jgi:hypothetical protein
VGITKNHVAPCVWESLPPSREGFTTAAGIGAASDAASLPLAIVCVGMAVVIAVLIINAIREHQEFKDSAKSRQRIKRELARMTMEARDAGNTGITETDV